MTITALTNASNPIPHVHPETEPRNLLATAHLWQRTPDGARYLGHVILICPGRPLTVVHPLLRIFSGFTPVVTETTMHLEEGYGDKMVHYEVKSANVSYLVLSKLF